MKIKKTNYPYKEIQYRLTIKSPASCPPRGSHGVFVVVLEEHASPGEASSENADGDDARPQDELHGC